jgi:chromosomal replication initiation ATPase DnaA
MSQLALPLAWPPGPGDDAFLVSSSNQRAYALLDHWAAWPVMTALLVGPRKSGRSTLARVMAARSGATLIDGAEAHPETALFHAWNRAQETRRPLILVADAAPPDWRIGLPDLRSRLSASPVARIEPPDEALMAGLIAREFARRQVDARPELIDWLVPRLERSHIAVLRSVDLLDQFALAERRRLTIPLARTMLAGAGLIGEHSMGDSGTKE